MDNNYSDANHDSNNSHDRGPNRDHNEDSRAQPQVPTMCSICHSEPPVNAIQLNCGHIFCFLCIKSVSEAIGVCALCRAEIGIEFNFREHPILGVARVPTSINGHYWYYEGYRGWWLYDADTNRHIEDAYQRGESTLERFIAGSTYIIDVVNLVQQRKDQDGRPRKICRATLELENILGMAGLKGRDFSEMLEMMKSAAQSP